MEKRRTGARSKRRKQPAQRGHVDRRGSIQYTEDERLFSRTITEPELAERVKRPDAVAAAEAIVPLPDDTQKDP